MTPTEFADKAAKKIELILSENRPFERAVRNTITLQAKRIFIDGKNSAGSSIGSYSTKAIYVNPNTSSPRKGSTKTRSGLKLQGLDPTVGKTGEHVFTAETAWHGVKGTKAGDLHRTTYLAGGYKELRNRIGRRIDRVNLTFTNSLLSDFTNQEINLTSKNPIIKPEPIKISVNEYNIALRRSDNQSKREGLEKKYGTIFNLTKEEKQAFFKTLDFNFRKALQDG